MFAVISRATSFIIVTLVSSVGIFWSIRVAFADTLSARDSLADRRRATELVPADSRNWLRLARLQQQHGMASLPAYSRSIEASPLNVEAWIDMGLEQEINQDLRSAEATLLHAAEISREYVPRWSLLNFYFRRNDPVHFWPWARRALELGFTDLQPIFRMAWGLSQDSDQIEHDMVPDRPYVLGQYLAWLTSAGKPDAAAKIASRLIGQARPEEFPALEYYCNTQLALGRLATAKTTWAGMVSRHLIPADAESGNTALINGQFTHEPLNTGFDWRTTPVTGVFFRPTFPGLRINLSGKEPEGCELLSQYILLETSRKYELAYEYETSGIASDAGLSWRVLDAKSGTEFTRNPKNLSREKMGWDTISFVTPAQTQGGRLVLLYQRALGTTRISGWLQLKQVALTAAN